MPLAAFQHSSPPMNIRPVLLTLALSAAISISSFAQENRSPMADLVGAYAVDGLLFVSGSPEAPFSFRVVGADPAKIPF